MGLRGQTALLTMGSVGLALQCWIQGWPHMWLPEHDFFSILSHCSSSNSFANSPSLTWLWNAGILQSSTSILFSSCIPSILEQSITLEVPIIFPNINQESVFGYPLGISHTTPPKFSRSSSVTLKCLPSQTPVDKVSSFHSLWNWKCFHVLWLPPPTLLLLRLSQMTSPSFLISSHTPSILPTVLLIPISLLHPSFHCPYSDLIT